MTILYAIIAFVVVERLAELVLARRNTALLMAAGGVEHGRGHYPLIVILHGSWLLAIAILIPENTQPNWWFLCLFLALQPVRYWIIATLGRRWTTRIIVMSDTQPIQTGPYRWLRHPNYAVVAAEILLLPLAFGAWEIAFGFSALNAAILSIRIRAENRLLYDSRSRNRE